MSGDEEVFDQVPHYNNQGGAYQDLRDIIVLLFKNYANREDSALCMA